MSALKSWIPDRRSLAGAVILCVLVAATAYLCVVLPRSQGRIAPIWLANAWVVAAMLRSPGGRWPAFAVAAIAGNVLANILAGDPWVVALGLAACNSLECLSCALLVRRRCGPAFDIGRPRHLIWFVAAAVLGAALSACAISALLGVVDPANILRGLVVWIQADLLGLLSLAPALLVLSQRSRTPIKWRETWTLGALTLVAAGVFFISHYPLLFLVSAMLALPTWRMGLPGAVAGFAIIAAIGTAAALSGHGPIMLVDSVSRIVGLQIFLSVSFLTSVPLAVARDEGERLRSRLKDALVAARQAHAKAAQAAAVKTEFLANMSHELRTPLTSVVGFTRLAAEQPDLSPLSRDYIERVGEASRALLCAVNDILDFSKLEAGQVTFRPAPVAFGPLARNALNLFTPQAAAKDLALALDDRTPAGLVITADPDRLRQVLLNLLGNAVKFTEAGQVTLRAAYDDRLQQLTIDVLDTGPGIAADRLDRLFRRFSQVDGSLTREHGGTGLGLAICKGIVEAMGGTIGATSRPGEGSCFSFTVPAPLDLHAPVAATATEAEAEPFAGAGIRVLVTDDHRANRELVQLFLAGVGVEITEARDGEEAAQLAARMAFDVILMDLRMPKLDGAGALARIRATAGPNRDTPVLAFTADAECVFDGRLQAMGFDGAVAKPVEPSQLIAALASALTAGDQANRDVA